jgi:hypothetical protein
VAEDSLGIGRFSSFPSSTYISTETQLKELVSRNQVSLTYLLPVLLLPSKKFPELPPKMKYFHEGMDGAMTPLQFHLAI